MDGQGLLAAGPPRALQALQGQRPARGGRQLHGGVARGDRGRHGRLARHGDVERGELLPRLRAPHVGWVQFERPRSKELEVAFA